MFDWIKTFLFNLFSTFFGYFRDIVQSVLETLVGYVVDVFLWFWEWVLWIFDYILRFLWELAEPILVSGLETVGQYMPAGVFDAIVAAYAWFQFINDWVPVQYCINLFLVYYSMAISLYSLRRVLSFLPFGRA